MAHCVRLPPPPTPLTLRGGRALPTAHACLLPYAISMCLSKWPFLIDGHAAGTAT